LGEQIEMEQSLFISNTFRESKKSLPDVFAEARTPQLF
jgi:hypothetical protein